MSELSEQNDIQEELGELYTKVEELEFNMDKFGRDTEINSDRIDELTNKILSDRVRETSDDKVAAIISYLAYFSSSSFARLYKYVVIQNGTIFATNMYVATKVTSESFKNLPNGYYRSDVLQNISSVDALDSIISDAATEAYLKPVMSELDATIEMMKELYSAGSKSIPEYSLSVNNLKQIVDFSYAIQEQPANIKFVTSADFQGRKVVLCQLESDDITVDFLLSPVKITN